MEVCEDVDARTDMFGISIWQGGNRIGQMRDSTHEKWSTGWWSVKGTSVDHPEVKWPYLSGAGASAGNWDRQFQWVNSWITAPGSEKFEVIPAGKH